MSDLIGFFLGVTDFQLNDLKNLPIFGNLTNFQKIYLETILVLRKNQMKQVKNLALSAAQI